MTRGKTKLSMPLVGDGDGGGGGFCTANCFLFMFMLVDTRSWLFSAPTQSRSRTEPSLKMGLICFM